MYTEDIKNSEDTPSSILGKSVVRGSAWVLAARLVQLSVYALTTIVLARILPPKDFGIFGVSLLVLSMLNTFSQTGFFPALIHKKGDIRPYLDTVWTVNIARGFLIAVVIFLTADYAAIFFHIQGSAYLLKMMGFVALLQGATNVAVIYFDKELQFRKSFLLNLAGSMLEAGVSFAVVFVFRAI